MNIVERIASPTPKFFIKLRNISLVFATLGASILAAPIALPVIVMQVAGYIAVAGAVGSAVSQAVTTNEAPVKEHPSGTAFPER